MAPQKLPQLITYCQLHGDDEFTLTTREVLRLFSVSFRDAKALIGALIADGRLKTVSPRSGSRGAVYRWEEDGAALASAGTKGEQKA